MFLLGLLATGTERAGKWRRSSFVESTRGVSFCVTRVPFGTSYALGTSVLMRRFMIAGLRNMTRTAPILALFLVASFSGNSAPALTLNPYESKVDQTPRNAIDELVFAKLDQCKVQPATVCSDGVFVRRAYLDVIGTLPSG